MSSGSASVISHAVPSGQHARSAPNPGAPARRPQARLAHPAVERDHLHLAGPVEPVEVEARGALHREITPGVGVEQVRQRRHQGRRVVCGRPPGTSGGVGDHDGVAGSGVARRRARSARRDVVLRHRQPDGVEIAADHGVRTGNQRRKLGTDRAGDVVDAAAREPRARCRATRSASPAATRRR